MKKRQNLRGHLSLAVMGVVLVLIISTASKNNPYVYSQLASVEPTAAEQIWQIGNQPVGHLQTSGGETQGEMWDLNSSYQNIEFQNSAGLQNNQSDIWSRLDSEVQTSQAQVANNPIQAGSTFSTGDGPAPLSSFEMANVFDQPQQESSWWSSSWDSVGSWSSGAIRNVEGWFGVSNTAGNACPDGVCDALGIRG